MGIVRAFRSGVVLAGLGCFGLAILPGCDEGIPSSGGQVKEDPDVVKKREQMIQDMYKANPAKGPHGQHPPGARSDVERPDGPVSAGPSSR